MTTRGETVFAAFYDRLESLKDYSTQPDRQARIQQFFVALSEEHARFLEQVEIVEKKAASLQEPENPLDVENMDSCEHLGPEDRQALEYVIANSLNSLKKTLCEAVESWNNSLQEYSQAEKKRNSKSVTKEGKQSSSILVLEGKSSSSEQLTKSSDILGIRGVDLIAQEGNVTPSLTPWGSRSASPYPSPDTNGDAPEVLSGPDMEVLHATSGFRPIPCPECTETDVHTPAESPTEGILPVGGVVKGHSLPGAKTEPLARVRLEKDLTSSHRSDTFKAFVVIGPSSEEGLDGSLSGTNENFPASDPECQTDKANEPSREKMDGDKEPSGGTMDDAKDPSGGKMDGAKEPSGGKMDGGKEPSGVRWTMQRILLGVRWTVQRILLGVRWMVQTNLLGVR
ncbi:hypothetical protein OS493_014281 [Desmophyllum pertusum]|uniref:Uncharacterized protein n=1 Tax=Desmophyllum pertusum TaxID=174260 RepID=A0A9W9Z3P2_9CNID|nr:hypothetical protein OS493_014281 [Desmophyllum pertusum]